MGTPGADIDVTGPGGASSAGPVAARAPIYERLRAASLAGRRRAGAAIAIAGGAILLSGCNAPTFGAFRGATTQGHATFKLWVGMVVAGLIVAGIVWALIFYSVIRYRRRGEGEIPRQFTEHIPLEIVYTVIPFIVVLVIFYFTVVTENQVNAIASNPAVTVNVTGFQWGWSFQYKGTPVDIYTSSEPGTASEALPPTNPIYPQLVLPEGETTQINLFGNDVAHSLWVPAFNFSRMALPGHENQFDFTPTELGVFDGRCNQYCGLYHSEMLFSVRVVTPQQFTTWLSDESKHATPPPKLGHTS
jgi:cytochrome c oxidase subunit 2